MGTLASSPRRNGLGKFVMTQLVISLILMLLASAFSSIAEAAFYSIPNSSVEYLRAKGSKSGHYLYLIKQDMERNIASILVFNTVSNTIGVFVATALGMQIIPEYAKITIPIGLTILILLFGELIPKIIGVNHARTIAPLLAIPFYAITKLLTISGILWPILRITRGLTPKQATNDFRVEDLSSLSDIGLREGVIDAQQAEIIKNILSLKSKTVRSVLTPRQVVFCLPARNSIAQCLQEHGNLDFSRIPLYNDDKEVWSGMLLRRDAYNLLADGKTQTLLKSIQRPLPLVPDSLGLDRMLAQFLRQRGHMAAVVDEYGTTIGIVTLEDVLEGILGREIVDEFDQSVDMQEDARRISIALAAIKGKESPAK